MILGITGGTGCGKTTLLELIRARGGLVLDCDAIYHDLLKTDATMLGAIQERFPTVFDKGGLVIRKLGQIVFADPNALSDLNTITHAAVKQEVMRRLKNWHGHAAIDAIALLESGLAELCDITVAVTAPLDDRIQRLIVRDGITEEYARNRIAAQKSETWFCENCDFVLQNNSDRQTFTNKCIAFLDLQGIIADCNK